MSRPYLLYCSALLLLFGFLSYSAILTKSPTFDEPAHICSSYIALHDGDFSVEPDHPPLWKYWAALPLLTTPFNANTNTPIFHRIPFQADTEFPWSVGTLFQTPENNTPFIINSTRFMMLLIALALGATIALFTHHLAGPLAACIATTLFALDPNFLAHASLVKNDVALAATYTALTYTLYLICQHLTPLRLLSLILLTTACVTTKLTGLLAAPLVVAVLLTRAFQSTPWPLRYPLSSILYPLSSRRSRLLLTLTLSALCFLTTYAGIWSVYRFRFNPSPDPAVHYDTQQFLTRAAKGDLLATLHRNYATAAEFNAWKPSPTLRLGLYALDHHLLPEPFVEGLIFANASSRSRPSFFLGSISTSGHLAYFPLAFLVKTPLTTLFILLLSLLLFASPFAPSRSLLLIPFLIYLLPTLFTSINIGIRHILPLYPLLYIAAAIPLSRLYTQYPKLLRPLFALLFLTLSIETLTAYPNYIPFFNAAAGGYRGGLHLLGDSNLDWGQDLPLLADWQQHHPGRTLHLAYFGTADPAYYGIHYQNLPHGYRFSPDPPPPPALPTTGVLAISASNLQSVEFSDPHDPIYVPFLHRKPTLILGGSIYLFDLDHPTR